VVLEVAWWSWRWPGGPGGSLVVLEVAWWSWRIDECKS